MINAHFAPPELYAPQDALKMPSRYARTIYSTPPSASNLLLRVLLVLRVLMLRVLLVLRVLMLRVQLGRFSPAIYP